MLFDSAEFLRLTLTGPGSSSNFIDATRHKVVGEERFLPMRLGQLFDFFCSFDPTKPEYARVDPRASRALVTARVVAGVCGAGDWEVSLFWLEKLKDSIAGGSLLECEFCDKEMIAGVLLGSLQGLAILAQKNIVVRPDVWEILADILIHLYGQEAPSAGSARLLWQVDWRTSLVPSIQLKSAIEHLVIAPQPVGQPTRNAAIKRMFERIENMRQMLVSVQTGGQRGQWSPLGGLIIQNFRSAMIPLEDVGYQVLALAKS